MLNTRILGSLATAAVLGAVGLGFVLRPGGAPEVERIDFGTTITATTPAFDATVKPASKAGVKEFRIPMTHRTIEIAPGVK